MNLVPIREQPNQQALVGLQSSVRLEQMWILIVPSLSSGASGVLGFNDATSPTHCCQELYLHLNSKICHTSKVQDGCVLVLILLSLSD